MEKLADFIDYSASPSTWPEFWRRAYLLTLPISFPLHTAVAVPLLLLWFAIEVVTAVAQEIHAVWRG